MRLASLKRCFLADRERAIEHLQTAVQVWQGDFLEDLDAGDWAIYRREELHHQCVNTLIELGQARISWPRTTPPRSTSTNACLLSIIFSNWLIVELMRCYARQGESGQAVRHYQQCTLRCAGTRHQPSPETTLLYQRLRRGDAI